MSELCDKSDIYVNNYKVKKSLVVAASFTLKNLKTPKTKKKIVEERALQANSNQKLTFSKR